MKYVQIIVTCIAVVAVGSLAGCGCCKTESKVATKPVAKVVEVAKPVVQAVYATDPITIDGKLDEPIWKDAPAHEFDIPKDRVKRGSSLQAAAKAKVAWDADNLYVGFELEDRDVIAESDKDNEHHYLKGDVLECFVKPDAATWYWELYVTPKGNKSTFFFPSAGYLGLPSAFNYQGDLTVAANVEGTINKWQDTDNGWTAEMVIPRSELTKHGGTFDQSSGWTIFLARYNYSYHLTGRGAELSSHPQAPRADWHNLKIYAKLELLSKPDAPADNADANPVQQPVVDQ